MAKGKKKLQLNDPAIQPLAVHIVLDESGSMNSMKSDAIGSFNDYVENLVKDNPTATVSLTTFGGSGNRTVVDNVIATAVEPLTDANYHPTGGTPLYDAITDAVTKLDATTTQRKVMVIITDGEENASARSTKDSVKTLLGDRQENARWLVLYLAANVDAFATGQAVGTKGATTLSFNATGGSLRSATASAFASTARYGSAVNIDDAISASAFTPTEREAAVDDDAQSS